MTILKIADIGKIEYKRSLALQKRLVEARKKKQICDTLLLVEHPGTITLGKQTNNSDLVDEKFPIFKIDRGGSATYHGPGQLIGYIIMDLIGKEISISVLVRKIEKCLIDTLAEYNIESNMITGKPGVWYEQKKIASIGLAVKKWITYHGFCLNINTDLEAYNAIKPCGFDSKIMTSLKQLKGKEISEIEVKEKLVKNFTKIFNYEEIEYQYNLSSQLKIK
tara:strand:- start:23 stop:685 length:663 start_codon:yes stop_codon:yes gene_type:complete